MTKGKGVESTPGPITCEHGNRVCGFCVASNKHWEKVGPELLEAAKRATFLNKCVCEREAFCWVCELVAAVSRASGEKEICGK